MTVAGTSAKLLPAHGDSFLILRRATLCAGACFLLIGASIRVSWPQQAVLAILTVLLAYWMDRGSSSYLATLTLMFVSLFSTVRYGLWRASTTGGALSTGHGTARWFDTVVMSALLAAEAFAFIRLSLGYLQTLWPLRRTPVALPDDPDDWPAVDVLIPTLNEPLSIVRYTVLAAANIDWPADRLNVCLLDDGQREEFRLFAQEAGIGYMTRADRRHAKAGNINHALNRLSAPFVAIFDCDHVPTRSFLQMTVGWFLRDARLGALQTPQHLYSPDPFDRNLEQFRMIPNEGELFYGIVQDGHDFWNSTLYCGSCAVLRRSALDEIGGLPIETLTEDVHTSLRLQKCGWNTAYINIPQAAGLAAESLGSHVKQRVRWACGMIQVLRLENPLFTKGLSVAQRLCYFNSMAHFFYALPRLIFLLVPVISLVSGHVPLPGFWAAILAYAAPHLALSSITNSRIQGQHRHTFWNGIYETILAPFLLVPTLLALVDPRSSRFEVAPRGTMVDKSYFDRKSALPYLAIITLQIVGLLLGAVRLFSLSSGLSPTWQHTLRLAAGFGTGVGKDLQTGFRADAGLTVLNMVWAMFNVLILGVCTAVAWESRQRRATVRISMAVPVEVVLANGMVAAGLTEDISISGVALKFEAEHAVAAGDAVHLVFPALDGEASLPATVVGCAEGLRRAHFEALSVQEEEALTTVLYSRADTWLGWGETREMDRPLQSLARILMLSVRGIWRTITSEWRAVQPPDTKFTSGIAQAGILLAVLLGLTAGASQRRAETPRLHTKPSAAVSSGRASSETYVLTRPPAVSSASENQPSADSDDNFNSPPMTGQEDAVPDGSLDLSHLPAPFINNASGPNPAIPIVFLSSPSDQGLKAAGIIASWFGTKVKAESVQFHVSLGTIPAGNAVVVIENRGDFLPSLKLPPLQGPSIAMRPNPVDPEGVLLIVFGGDGDETIQAATGLALRHDLNGLQATLTKAPMLPSRTEEDGPHRQQRQGESHRVTLPDVGLFARTGFPFTRMADLSETAILLPASAGSDELELYLTLVGRFAMQTGYPATKLTVFTHQDIQSAAGPYAGKDLLVLGTPQDQPALSALSAVLPVAIGSDGLAPKSTNGVFAPVRHAWWRFKNWEPVAGPGLETVRGLPPAVIEQTEWPEGSRRSLVIIVLRESGAIQSFTKAYAAAPPPQDAGKSVSVLQNGQFTSFNVDTGSYHVGQVTAWERVKLFTSTTPWIIALLAIADSFAMSIVARAMLRNHARSRLLANG